MLARLSVAFIVALTLSLPAVPAQAQTPPPPIVASLKAAVARLGGGAPVPEPSGPAAGTAGLGQLPAPERADAALEQWVDSADVLPLVLPSGRTVTAVDLEERLRKLGE